MNRYKCNHCGREFEEPDVVTEPHGEKVGCCPYCHGWFEEVYECKICGDFFTDDELTNGVCDECIYEHATDIDFCAKLGNDYQALEKININGLVASFFTEEQINTIMLNKLKELNEFAPLSFYEFIDSDKWWFADKLKEIRDAEEF